MTDLSTSPPPVLHPPDDETKGKEGTTYKQVIVPVVLCLLILLILLVAVIWLLPQKKAPLPEISTAGDPLTQPVDDPSLTKQKQEAQELLQKWLTLQVRAEADNVTLWGHGEYDSIRRTVALADDAMQHHSFEDAQGKYSSAIEQLEKLLAKKGAILETALETGHAALAKNESIVATEAFQRALAIDPDNREARNGERRAAVRDEVNGLLAEALEKEEEGELSSALALLTDLLALDEEYIPGQEAHKRITGLVEDAEFQNTMTSFLTALDNNDLQAARRAYAEAKDMRGNDTAVTYAGRRLAEAEEAAGLRALRSKAERQSNDERWSDALATYTAALTIAPQAIFAVNGRREAKKRAELDTALESILSHPERLQEDGPMKEAEQTLDYALGISDRGPRLQKQINRLSQVLDFAATPVTINLTSDNETDVVIYRVGRMGRFLSKNITVRPGTYTIVGSRQGYRDVRITLNVKPGQGAVPVSIMCEEPI